MTLVAGDDHIETERLILRHIASSDLAFYARIHADPDVARYLGHGNPRTDDETRAWMETVHHSYATLRLGQLAVTLKSDGSLVGRCGLSYLEVETATGPDGSRTGYYLPSRAPEGVAITIESELGYTLDQSAWGCGYAREAVAAVARYVRDSRPTERVVSLIHADNARSKNLADRFSVVYVDRVLLWGRHFERYAWPAGNSPSTDR